MQSKVQQLEAAVAKLERREQAARVLLQEVQRAAREGRILSDSEKRRVVDEVINSFNDCALRDSQRTVLSCAYSVLFLPW